MNRHQSSTRLAFRFAALITLVSVVWLSAVPATAQVADPAQRRYRADPPAEPKGDAAPRITVYRLKYADASSLMRILAESVDPEVRISTDTKTRSLVALGSPEAHQQIVTLLKELDVPPQDDNQIKVFSLIHTDPNSAAKMLREVLPTGGVQLATDERTNSLVISGPGEALEVAEAILLRLDQESERRQSEEPQSTPLLVHVVWLVSGPSGGEAAQLAKELNPVVDQLAKIGVTGVRQVGQVLVNTTSDGRFEIRCSPIFEDHPADWHISGRLEPTRAGRPGDAYRMLIDLAASQRVKATNADPNARNTTSVDLVEMQVEIDAPLGRFIVLGATPIGKATSAFVVYVSPMPE